MKTNGKITKELKDLGTKINGKAPNGETISELIKGIATDYEGGGTGGSSTKGTYYTNTMPIFNQETYVYTLATNNIVNKTNATLNVDDLVLVFTTNENDDNVVDCVFKINTVNEETLILDWVGYVNYDSANSCFILTGTSKLEQASGLGPYYFSGCNLMDIDNRGKRKILPNSVLIGDNKKIYSLFSIDENTGDIIVVEAIDFN